MSNNSTPLARAISALQNKNAPLTIQICDSILAQQPASADAHHIKALASKILGLFAQAEQSFYQSLHYQPNQPVVMSNLANLLMGMGKFDQASKFFESSTQLAKNSMDAWLNWSIMLCKLTRYDEAIIKLNQAILVNNKDARIFNVLGNAYQKLENFDESINAFNNALLLNPNDLQALHNKGITFRMMNMPEKSIECYQNIQQSNHRYPELYFNIGCAFYDLNNKAHASENLQMAIDLKADYVEAHEALNKLYWEENNTTQFLVSYLQSFKQAPDSTQLTYSYIAMLIMSKRYEEAKIVLESSIEKFGRDVRFLHALAILIMKEPNHSSALPLLQEVVELQPLNIKYQIDIANYYIQNKDYELALEHLDLALITAPLNQEILAYKGLCWRLTNNPNTLWLNNYDSFIQAAYLPVPEGYKNLPHFMSELREALYKLHKTEHQPLDQSVVGGTQTVGRLLAEPIKVIQDFKQVLEQRVNQYLHQLPIDVNHPFLNRNTRHFKFSGSWSVRLKDGGFHVNHVHPEGWLSCCTYVDIPTDIREDDPLKKGWIKFGETSLNLENRESIDKQICPSEGLCVLFPSYFWHGTNPFESNKYRMTIPCDIMPI